MKTLLTNLNWLEEGQKFPPDTERERLKKYENNSKLFETKHIEVMGPRFSEIIKRLKKKGHDVDVVLNYHQLLSKKTADFVCSIPPSIETEEDTDGLLQILKKQLFFRKLYEATIDVSRYGDAVFKIVENRVTAVNPGCWFPVCDPTDVKYVTHHVIAYGTNPDKDGKMTQLYVEIHFERQVETRTYSLENEEIGKLLKGPEITQFDSEYSAIQVIQNITTTSSLFGIDDYSIVNSLIEKVMWRLGRIDKVLDKHSEPSMQGPTTSMIRDEKTGVWYFPLGNYLGRKPEDAPLEYVTWDGNLEASFKELDFLLNQLYALSEMGATFIDAGKGGSDSTGTALKLRMVSPRIKAQRIIGINEQAIKSTICALAEVNGVYINSDTLELTWKDGLPKDDVEETNTLVQATGGPIMSLYAALKSKGLSDEATDAEMQQIKDERLEAQPVVDIPEGVNDDTKNINDDD
jgi:hypothetical protein